MRARATMLVAVTAVIAAGVLAGCSEDRSDDPEPAGGSTPAPALGGPAPAQHRPPQHAMGSLERPVAERLARRIAADDLRLDYLDCPHWDGTVPSAMTCEGYVDGLIAQVRVRLAATGDSGVGFDARLATGVVATRRLESTLRRQGWSAADCGDVAAYPAQVGMRIVCRVTRGGTDAFVVATVRSQAGRVTIADYARTSAAP